MKDFHDLLHKFWAGKATGTEKLQLYKLIVEQEQQLQSSTVPQHIPAHPETGELLAPEESRKMLELLHQEITPQTHRNASSQPEQPIRRIPWLRLTAAAAILTAIAFGFNWMLTVHKTNRTQITATTKERTITNALADVQTIQLEDSSIVSIYPGGSITLPDTFTTGSQRFIHLKGKAGFKVKHDARHPFQVIARQLKTTDIGTDFSIDASQTDIVKVKLNEGSVRIESLPGSSIALDRKMQTPGEEIKINLVTAQITTALPSAPSPGISPALFDKRAAPARTRLVFSRTPLAEVFAKLAKREQVRIIFDQQEVEGLTFTGNIESKDQLDTIMNVLCGLNGLSYSKNGTKIVVTKSN